MDSSFTGLEKLKWKFEILLSFICKSEVWAHTALFGGQLLQFSNSQNHDFIHTALSLSLLLGKGETIPRYLFLKDQWLQTWAIWYRTVIQKQYIFKPDCIAKRSDKNNNGKETLLH